MRSSFATLTKIRRADYNTPGNCCLMANACCSCSEVRKITAPCMSECSIIIRPNHMYVTHGCALISGNLALHCPSHSLNFLHIHLLVSPAPLFASLTPGSIPLLLLLHSPAGLMNTNANAESSSSARLRSLRPVSSNLNRHNLHRMPSMQWLFRTNIPRHRRSLLNPDLQKRNLFGMGEVLSVLANVSHLVFSLNLMIC